MTDRADVVIIGGGVIGAATAFHLARLGVRDVVIVERDQVASGSTSKSAGGVRFQFADELNVKIMQRSLPEFEHFDAMIAEHAEAGPIGFHQVGYLFLCTEPADASAFADATALQQALGVDTRVVTADEAAAMVPGLVVDDLRLATWNPREGHCSPEAVVFGYVAAARALGCRVLHDAEVHAIDVDGGAVSAVHTRRGTIATDTVVCAAGAWSADVGRLLDVDIPITAERRHMWFTTDPCGQPDTMPMTIDFASSFYAHREGPGLVFGGREPDIESVGGHALRRLPVIAQAPLASSWSGLYENSPDHNAIVGRLAEIDGAYIAAGFSGHGFQQAPAIGEHLAQLITGTPVTLDLSPFAPDRFATARPRAERFIV